MNEHTGILILTTASIAFLHTVLGPDHYIPFIAMSKAAGWSRIKTIRITLISGLGHVFSSVVLGAAGIILGTALNKLEYLESIRGEIAGWMLISFGLIYFAWSIRKVYRDKKHVHMHKHDTGEIHIHEHNHKDMHTHLHPRNTKNELTPWIIFTIFIFGPCEPLIPLMIYPGVSQNFMLIIWVVGIFSVITTGTMLLIVIAGLKGLSLVPFKWGEAYANAAAGILILICGISMIFFGL